MADDELTALAMAAARGDRDALTELVRATQRDVMRFLAPLTTYAEVEDLTQETFLRAVKALPTFQARSSVRTWLFAIARRVAADDVRKATRSPRQSPLPETLQPTDGRRFDEQQALQDLLHTLPQDRREAFVATQIAGLSYAEAAEVCNCPVGTIRSRVARAREDLIEAMRDGRAASAG